MKEYSPESKEKYIIMTRRQVRDFDAWAINQMHIPGIVLMENAGRSCAELIVDHLKNVNKPKVCIFTGTGNNGGDGYVIARHLANTRIDVIVVICGDRSKIKGDALINLRIIENMKLPIELIDPSDENILNVIRSKAAGCQVIIDAIFGTGLQGELRDEYARLITSINACGIDIIAVDIPSGLDCDTGLPLPVSIEAAATVTFVAVKKGFAVCPQSRQATGRVYIASIGIDPSHYNL